MSFEQEKLLQKAGEKLQQARIMLDDIMYRMLPLPEEEYKKIREGYDLICKAYDKLL